MGNTDLTSQQQPFERRSSVIAGGEMGALIRAKDWSATPLGPLETWPASLVTTVSLVLSSMFPIAIVWGSGHVQLYNDGYWPICGPKHPRSMGQDFRACWASAFPIIGAAYERGWAGEPSYLENQRMFLDRNGYLEETFFTFSISPIRDETGQVAGLFHPATETTAHMVGERRVRALRDLAARGGKARSVDEACLLVAETLADYDLDVPFVLLYLATPDRTAVELAAAAGLSPGHRAAPRRVTLGDAEQGWPFAAALGSDQAVVVDDVASRCGALACGPYPEAPSTAFLWPIRLAGIEQPVGVVIAGASARLPLDDAYRAFYGDLANAIASVIANARAYAEERRRSEALAELDRAKMSFFSNVSHEFRTPLTLMLGPMEDALARPDRALSGEALDVTHRNALRLLELVNALLDFSRIEAGRMKASYEPVDLAALTIDLASVFRAAIERAGLRLVVRCERPAEPVYVDREMWEKIVLNLLSNAFKFTFEGEIEVALSQVDDRAVLTVRDTGTGVSADELPRLFERFHRIEGARSRTHEGSGIGLALVQELVRMHGGEIRAESTSGHGTTFTVSIPTGTAHLAQDRIVAAEARPATADRAAVFVEEALRWLPDARGAFPDELDRQLDEVAPRVATRSRAGARVLVADDNADMRDYLRRILGARWHVEAVGDGDAALASARRAPPDLVVADVMMPGLTGFGLLAGLRTDPRTRSIPVVLLSARAGEEARIEGLEAGADEYLVKPFSARELAARVESQLALSASRHELARLLEREQAAHADAELQRQHLHALLMQAPTPIVILRGPAHAIELANPEACRISGRRREDVIGRPLLEALPELSGQVFRELLDGVIREGVPHVGKEVVARLDRGRDGTLETVYFNFVYTPLRGVGGAIDGVLVIAFDVTDEVRARDGMAALRDEAEAASRAKDELLALLEHELRNPLAPVVTTLELARERGLGAHEQAILERQVAELVRFVDDLLDVSRLARGPTGLGRQPRELAGAAAGPSELERPPGGAAPAAVGATRSPPPAEGARILVVDDNRDAAETLQMALEARGHHVAVAYDGPSALKTAKTFAPEIAFLDIGLPGMDGYELARQFRSHPGDAHDLHLVAVTGYGQPSDRQRSAAAGFDRHLVKPVSLAQLDRVVQELRP